MDFKSGLSMIVRRVIVVQLLTIGSLSNNDGDGDGDGDGYKKDTEKVNLLCLKPYLAYSMSNDGNSFWS